MQPPQVEYRRVKVPRTDMLFAACWFDIDESLDIFARFTEQEAADNLAEQLESIGYEPIVFPGNLPTEDYHEVLIYLQAPKSCQDIWVSGVAISEEEANKLHTAIDELIR